MTRPLLYAAVAVVAAYGVLVALFAIAGRRETARAVAGFVPDCIVLFTRLLRDERVPRRQKLLVGALLPYLAMPIDVIPDFIPIAGQLDDAVIVAFVLRRLVRANPNLVDELWPGPAASRDLILRIARR